MSHTPLLTSHTVPKECSVTSCLQRHSCKATSSVMTEGLLGNSAKRASRRSNAHRRGCNALVEHASSLTTAGTAQHAAFLRDLLLFLLGSSFSRPRFTLKINYRIRFQSSYAELQHDPKLYRALSQIPRSAAGTPPINIDRSKCEVHYSFIEHPQRGRQLRGRCCKCSSCYNVDLLTIMTTRC